MTLLLPRLSPMAVDEYLSNLPEYTLETLHLDNICDLPASVSYGRSGGSMVDKRDLFDLKKDLESIALKCGWPVQSVRNHADFDANAAQYLAGAELFDSGEAFRDDIWACISTTLLFELTFWRFGSTRSRYHGGIRNCFQRLWVRGFLFDRGESFCASERWSLLRKLTEDAFVAITERPSLCAEPEFSRSIAESWLRCSKKFNVKNMESTMRLAMINIRILNETRMLTRLPKSELEQLLDTEFEAAWSYVFKRKEPDYLL